ncbi:ATP-binding protein [Desulfovibrio subterraneus]|uniref:histidine kinase n=1 Tax=Desulfovibrio subterraneus TaxID=2718620 RepID=A0A7J0BM37_9BACT|nr:ATP-binding protein [Desulfovibrio subterraneus]GFM34709.1 PAS domain-containing sensor histidine kinase [Desulfovibrio subterraneus]
MKNFSIRNRLLIGTALLLLVTLLPPFYYFDNTLRGDIMNDAEDRAVKGLDTVEHILKEYALPADSNELDARLTRLGERMGMRITYIVDGIVVADSNVPIEDIPSLDPHGGRPEVRQALDGETGLEIRYSTTLKKYLIYVARTVHGANGLQDGVLRVAIPVSVAKERLDRLESGMTWMFLVVILASSLIAYFSTRPLLRSIIELASTAQSIGQGHYNRRIREYPGTEFKPLVDAINGMAHNIEQHLSMLVDQKGRLEAVFNGMNEGVMVFDSAGRIHSFNKALTTIFPGIEQKIGATPIEATMKPELHRMVIDLIEQGEDESGVRTQMELSDSRFFEVNLVPFKDPAGARRVVAVFYDISERERLEKVRRDFVANVSHELKTPLTSIKGFAETLIESPPAKPEQTATFLKTILKNANHMTKMVNSLLVLARTQHKGEMTDLAPVDAHEVIRQSLRDLSHTAQAKNITLEDMLPEGPLSVLGDRDGLMEVFRNLLDNAIKYSPAGSSVSVTARPHEGKMALCVRDQGPGIPEKAKDRIFERFYRIEHPSEPAAKNGSAGLGLAICRRIIKSHGGDIWVESPLDPATGTGAAFFATLQTAERQNADKPE